MADSDAGEVAPKTEPPSDSASFVTKQSIIQDESTGRSGLPERPKSRSPSENNHSRGDRKRDSHNRQQGGSRGRRKLPPPFSGRGPPSRPGRLSPGPPPMPPPGPPPAGYRRLDRLTSPTPHRRGRSPEPPRRRTPPPLPPVAQSLPPPSYGRSRYNSPPRRSPPPIRRWPGPRSRSPPPRGYRSPPGPRRRRSPIRSPPPRRRSPPGMYRRSSRSPLYKRRPSPYSPRRASPGRRSPPRTGNRTRSVSPQPFKHRLPSPGRSTVRSHLPSAVRSGTNSRRVSPSATREYSPNGRRSPGKRTRSPSQGGASIKEEDDHISKKRKTLDGEPPHNPSASSPMRGVKIEPEEQSIPHRSEGGPPTEPKSFRESNSHVPAVLRVKTEVQDIEMADGTAAVASPVSAAPATPATWKVPKVPAAKTSSTPAPVAQQPTAPVLTIPKMPVWKKDSVTAELDAEIERIRSLRINSTAEHNTITTAVRRALYELELVDFDLRGSEARLAVAQKQSELAAKGMPIYIEDNLGA